MALELMRYAAVPSTPWKNGLGLTRQLAIHPPAATAQEFEWRVSIAQLTGTAPFSKYPGIGRCLAVLEGALRLQFEAHTVCMTAHCAPLEFSGAAAVIGVVEHAPALDLNLMFQAARWRGTLSRLTGSEGAARLGSLTGTRLVCSLQPALRLQCAAQELTLGRYDLLRSDDALRACEASSLDVYSIELQPA